VTSQPTVGGSLTFLLGKLGGVAANRFAERLAALGLRPRHCAVLELAGAVPLSQLELATRIGVTPSVVVDMLDELEALDAIRRVPQESDRRRRIIELTPTGRELRRQAGEAAHQVDAELLSGIDPRRRAELRSALAELGAAQGLDYEVDVAGAVPESTHGSAGRG
jgi:DNA-binding MarR family transcriptional regulator